MPRGQFQATNRDADAAALNKSLVKRATPFAADLLESHHIFELTEDQVAQIFHREIYRQVIATRAFQRLKKIHFLGSLDYVIDPEGPKPNKRHTRFQHSLGVARLALQFARDRRLEERDEVLSVVAALLHDIGHAPLSHSLESVFKKSFGLGHHLTSEMIVKGDADIGRDLHRVLVCAHINPFEILLIMNGKGSGPFRELFGYAINIDTIEAICRSVTYIYQNHLSRPPSEVLNAFLTPCEISTEALDSFWRLKDEIYNRLITSRLGVLADYICQRYMQDHISSFGADQFYLNEVELIAQHPRLFEMLRGLSATTSYSPDVDRIDFKRRRFIVNSIVPLDHVPAVDERYIQTRQDETLKIQVN
jgi:uncharacterized protein